MAHHPHKRGAAARAGVHRRPHAFPGTVHALHDTSLSDARHSIAGHPTFDPLVRRIEERAGLREKQQKQVPEAQHPLSQPPAPKDAAYYAKYQQKMVAETGFRHGGVGRQLFERERFSKRLQLLREGYKSELTLDDFVVNCECGRDCSCGNGRVLGEGAFGRVVLATMKPNARAALRNPAAGAAQEGAGADEAGEAGADGGDVSRSDLCVIKMMLKQQIVDDHEVEHTMNERTMLFTLQSQFIINFLDYMQDMDYVYFVFDVAPCTMQKLLDLHDKRFDSRTTQFFTAQLVLAFEYLRHLDVVYRDLKPDNLVVDFNGNMKLIDFGTAKRLDDKTHRTYTFCGTQEYMAPEVITNRGYSFEVDWWAIGVVVYEFRTGVTPFKKSESELDILRRITFVKYGFPHDGHDLTNEEMLFIGMLLQHDAHKRLGSVAMGGVERVMKEDFFRGISFEALFEGHIPSPVLEMCAGWKEKDLMENFPEESDSTRRPVNGWNMYERGEHEEDPYQGAFDTF
eukprot:m.59900 g.59900  ORF g.59900 m.59900 type:complete len:512 (-) comp9484_c0_seq1:222-1757(-)